MTNRLIAFVLVTFCVSTAWAGGMVPQVQYAAGDPVEVWKTYLAVVLLAVSGMGSNFLRRWLTGQISGNPVAYLFTDNPKRTALALFTLFGSVGAAIAAGQFDGMTIKQLFLPAFLLGYASDTLNKGGALGQEVK